IWWKWGRDPDPGMSVAPMYEPPAGISPAEAGTLLGDSIHPRDITSTIVDLAVRGFVKIEETKDSGLVFHHKDYILHLLIPREQWQNVQPHERVMLENVFATGTDIRLSDLKNRFYTAIPVIRQNIMAELKTKGMYMVDPESANGYSFVGLLIISAIISAIVWWLFARQMTAKTLKGCRTQVAVLGFQEFMNRVDKDRLQRMPPDTFE